MQAVIGALRVNFSLDSAQFERGAKRAQGSLSKTNNSFNVVQRSAARLATALAGVFASRELIRNIADFETSMSRVGAISRANATDLADMRDIAKQLGSTTEFTAAQAADGLGFLAMAGFDARESIAAIPGVLDLATASGLGLAEAADIASNVMSGFGIAATDVGSVTDVLAATASRANTNVSQLGQAMSTVAPISKALNISIQDTSAAIGVLSDAGIQGERAGTNLRGILASLAGPTRQATDALANYGLTAADVNPETKSLADIFELLQSKSITTADALQIFGREAASGALVLVNASKQLRTFSGQLSNVEGAASDMAGVMRDNLGGDIKGLQSAISGLILAMGDAGLTTALRNVLQSMTDLTRFISDNFVPAIKIAGVVIVTLAATQIPLLVSALKTKVIALGLVTKAVAILRLAFLALGGPFGILLGLVSGAAAAFVVFKNNMDPATTETFAAQGAVNALNAALGIFHNTAAPSAGREAVTLANNYKTLAEEAKNAAQAEVDAARARLEAAKSRGGSGRGGGTIHFAARELSNAEISLNRAQQILNDAANRQRQTVTAVTGAMSESMTNVADAVANVEINVEALTSGFSGSREKVKEFTEEAEDRFAVLKSSIQSSMESGFMSIIDGTMRAKDAFKSMASEIIKELFRVLVVQRLVAGISSAFKTAFPSLAGPQTAANGTSYAQGGMTLVGERGPELVNMPRGSQVIDARRTASRMGNGDIVQNFNFNLSANGDESVRRIVSQAAPQIVEAAKAGVADAVRRGGSYGRAFA